MVLGVAAMAASGMWWFSRPNYSMTSCVAPLRQVDPTAVKYGIRVGLEDEHGVQAVAVRGDGSQTVWVGLLSSDGRCLNITDNPYYYPVGTPIDTEYYEYWTDGPALPPPVSDIEPIKGGRIDEATGQDIVTIGVDDAVTLRGRTLMIGRGATEVVAVVFANRAETGEFWLTGYNFGFRIDDEGGGGFWLEGADRLGQFQLIDIATSEIVITLVVE